jgi:hypothetical protein
MATPVVLATMTPGQTAVGVLTFDEAPPTDGAVTSDNTAVMTISLAPDHITWTAIAVAVGTCNFNYTGTSLPPDVGPVVVATMVGTVEAVPAAEVGNFNPATAVITGP